MATYAELAALRRNTDFASRVEIAVAKFAQYIMDEDPSTANHKIRFQWASNALSNPGSVAAGIMPAVVLDPAIGEHATDQAELTDAVIQAAVEASVNQVLNS